MSKPSNSSATFMGDCRELGALDESIGELTLRAWLEAAPRIGTLP